MWTWQLGNEAFGDSAPNQDPDNNGAAFVLDLRFPGQRYDTTSGLSYNYSRDYEPSAARYSQSDPVGLNGGIASYVYAGSNAMIYFDSKGLTFEDVRRTNGQVNKMFPELQQRGMLRCSDLPDDVNGRTRNLSGDILIPRKYCEMKCLARADWERLFWVLLHEGMHSSDPWWLPLTQWGGDEDRWHDGIYNRVFYEQDNAGGISMRNIRRAYNGKPMWGTPRSSAVNLDSLYQQYRSGASECCEEK